MTLKHQKIRDQQARLTKKKESSMTCLGYLKDLKDFLQLVSSYQDILNLFRRFGKQDGLHGGTDRAREAEADYYLARETSRKDTQKAYTKPSELGDRVLLWRFNCD